MEIQEGHTTGTRASISALPEDHRHAAKLPRERERERGREREEARCAGVNVKERKREDREREREREAQRKRASSSPNKNKKTKQRARESHAARGAELVEHREELVEEEVHRAPELALLHVVQKCSLC
jgi:hypothetical protein